MTKAIPGNVEKVLGLRETSKTMHFVIRQLHGHRLALSMRTERSTTGI